MNWKNIIASFSCLLLIIGSTYYIKQEKIHNSILRVEKESLTLDFTKKFQVVFDPDGLDSVALVMMIKDEEDIIYENLIWHFCLGFRKFVIVDNNSSDNTRSLIEKFKKEVLNQAIVVIIDDPILEYIQNKVTTSAFLLAKMIWPDVEWVFPVDADEFWLVENKLKDILQIIPNDVDIIAVYSSVYYASNDYYKLKNQPFWKKIHYRTNGYEKRKIALRTKINFLIDMGNHSAHFDYENEFWRQITLTDKPFYINADIIGIHMREFSIRSPEQLHKKFSNSMIAVIAAKDKGFINKNIRFYGDSYLEYVEIYGDYAKNKTFKDTMLSKNNSIYDPLPIDQAYEMFNQIIYKTH